MTWNIDDWCFFEFRLAQIKDVTDGRVTEVRTGYITVGSYDFNDKIKPLTMPYKVASDEVEAVYNKLHREGSPGLNWPELHRHLVRLWLKLCDAYDVELKGELISSAYEELYEFRDAILNICQNTTVDGIQLFK